MRMSLFYLETGFPISAKLYEQLGMSLAWPISEEKLGVCHQVDKHVPRHGIVGISFPSVNARGRSASSLEGECLGSRM